MNKSKVAIYARVSTDVNKTGTVDKRQDPQVQIDELREYCKRMGWDIYATYQDRVTGAHINRKNFTLMMEHAKQKRFDIVLVWSVDRFSRSLVDLLKCLENLVLWKVRFISYTQNIDTGDDSPMSEMLISLLGMFSQFERRMIQERVRAGLARAKSKGVKLGPKGLQDLAVGYLVECHDKGDSLREIRRKYREKFGKGVSIETIRKYIGRIKASG